ncbi:ABC-2 type transport system permease protein [Alteribacillus persepolensis]|uniref:ABC-2 type transport system permease protein n=1 Tax=Alteribacillus persepolensis TaxID=568899 RepID=A0A1G8ECE4_9BACI|nr:ABC transporter permease [Alteribacillus persepolensis]SDH67554.1 ABC-2 type transport system permease protein [Alteribacillus persepolensis]
MNNFWITVTHTAGKRIRSKAFIWSTVITMLLIIGMMNANTILSSFSNDEQDEDVPQSIAVVDNTTSNDTMGEMLASNEEGSFHYVNYTDGNQQEALEQARNEVYDFVLTLNGDPANLEAELFGSGNDYRMGQEVEQDVQRVKESVVTNQLDLNEEELAMIYSPVAFIEQPLTKNGEVQTEETHMQAYWMVYGLVFVIYLIVLSLGSMIATEVATEKSSRVMELIVSSVNPIVQMFGKLVGIGIVGLVNLASLVAAVIIGFLINDNNMLSSILGGAADVSLLVYALILIILGYFVYGGMAAMLGALVSRAEEVNQAIQPLIFLAMIAFFMAIFGLNAPDNIFIHVLSYIPFFTPQLLFLRIGMGTVPVWETILIVGLLILSAILINLLAARIYKGGVLMYGKFSFKNGIKQALTMSKKEK